MANLTLQQRNNYYKYTANNFKLPHPKFDTPENLSMAINGVATGTSNKIRPQSANYYGLSTSTVSLLNKHNNTRSADRPKSHLTDSAKREAKENLLLANTVNSLIIEDIDPDDTFEDNIANFKPLSPLIAKKERTFSSSNNNSSNNLNTVEDNKKQRPQSAAPRLFNQVAPVTTNSFVQPRRNNLMDSSLNNNRFENSYSIKDPRELRLLHENLIEKDNGKIAQDIQVDEYYFQNIKNLIEQMQSKVSNSIPNSTNIVTSSLQRFGFYPENDIETKNSLIGLFEILISQINVTIRCLLSTFSKSDNDLLHEEYYNNELLNNCRNFSKKLNSTFENMLNLKQFVGIAKGIKQNDADLKNIIADLKHSLDLANEKNELLTNTLSESLNDNNHLQHRLSSIRRPKIPIFINDDGECVNCKKSDTTISVLRTELQSTQDLANKIYNESTELSARYQSKMNDLEDQKIPIVKSSREENSIGVNTTKDLNEMSEYEPLIASMQATNEILRKEIIEKDNLIESFRKQSFDHLKQSNSIHAENSQLISACSNLKKILSENEKKIEELKSTSIKLENIGNMQLKALQKTKAEYEKVEQKLRSTEIECNKLNTELKIFNEIKLNNSVLTSRLTYTDAKVIELESRLSFVELERDRLMEANKEQQEKYMSQLSDFEKRLIEAHRETHNFQDEMSNAKKLNAELDKELKLVRQKSNSVAINDASINELKLKLSNLTSEKKLIEDNSLLWQNKYKKIEVEINSLKVELEEEKAKVGQLEYQISQIKLSLPIEKTDNSILLEKERINKQVKQLESERKMMALEREIFERQKVDIANINPKLKAHLNISDHDFIQPSKITPKAISGPSLKNELSIQERIQNLSNQCTSLEQSIDKTKR